VCLYCWGQKRFHLPDLDNDCKSKMHVDQDTHAYRSYAESHVSHYADEHGWPFKCMDPHRVRPGCTDRKCGMLLEALYVDRHDDGAVHADVGSPPDSRS